MRLPQKGPFIHFQFSDNSSITVTSGPKRSKAAIASFARMVEAAEELALAAGTGDGLARLTVQVDGIQASYAMDNEHTSKVCQRITDMLMEEGLTATEKV